MLNLPVTTINASHSKWNMHLKKDCTPQAATSSHNLQPEQVLAH